MRHTLLLLLFLPFTTLAWDLGELGNFQFEKVNSAVYVMHGPLGEPSRENRGFMNNPGMVIAEQGIILIDPGGTHETGQQVLAEIKKISDKPVIAVFNTHIHGDHWLGNQAVVEQYPGITIYAHPEMIARAEGEGAVWVDMMERLTEGVSKGTSVTPPNRRAQHSDLLEIGGQHFRIHALDPAHTNTDIMIEHVESKTLFTGDNSFNRRMARFDESSDMHGNIQALQYALDLKFDVYVPGHGRSGTAAQAIQPFLDYLQTIQRLVNQGYEDGLENYEIKEIALAQVTAYRDWENFDTNFGKHISKMYLEIEQRNF